MNDALTEYISQVGNVLRLNSGSQMIRLVAVINTFCVAYTSVVSNIISLALSWYDVQLHRTYCSCVLVLVSSSSRYFDVSLFRILSANVIERLPLDVFAEVTKVSTLL